MVVDKATMWDNATGIHEEDLEIATPFERLEYLLRTPLKMRAYSDIESTEESNLIYTKRMNEQKRKRTDLSPENKIQIQINT